RMKNSAVESEQKLDNIRTTMETRIAGMQADNAKKLDEMRQTVDEKLQKTLDDKLQQSFSRVSDQLEKVYKGLGEMQTLATGVGDLKKVLSNVKTRGILGEIQLGAILEQILSAEQYAENIATVKGSSERVEFAVKLPGDGETPVWLPIDAKFPADAYGALLEAYDAADAAAVDAAAKVLEQRIRGFAKDISTKYLHVPETTDFGIMFLPIEGLYAEVVRRGMVEKLQTDYKVMIAGPTTMAALLNSLQMGFRTLAIQERSGEVWKVLGSVKSEFDTFGKALEQTQSRIEQAGSELEKLVGVRTRQMQRRLSTIANMPELSTKEDELPLL
ncbi:MAG: DNA recombination protein RmuC, partial [Ruthenibacterium sp.]